MEWWQFGIWGLIGGIVVDGLAFQAATTGGRPVPPGYTGWAFWIGETIRLLAGGAVAIAFGSSALIETTAAALGVGIAAPLIVERLRYAAVPVPVSPTPHAKPPVEPTPPAKPPVEPTPPATPPVEPTPPATPGLPEPESESSDATTEAQVDPHKSESESESRPESTSDQTEANKVELLE